MGQAPGFDHCYVKSIHMHQLTELLTKLNAQIHLTGFYYKNPLYEAGLYRQN